MEPKNSLEALDNLVHCKSETRCKECHHKNVCTLERDYNIVKSDLETFNNENKVLKFENKILTEGLQELDQDIKDVMSDYQAAAKRMFKYVEAIDEILDYLKSHDVSIDFLSDIENIIARAGYYDYD